VAAFPSDRAAAPALSVLLYHEIGPQPRATANLDCFCTHERFVEQMHFLRDRAIAVRAAGEVYDSLARGEHLAADTVVLTFDDGDTGFLRFALPVLEELGFPATVFAVAGQLGRAAGWVKDPRNAVPLMSAGELRSLPAGLVDIGSHSMMHRKLPELPTEQARAELRDSKELLEDVLGRPVTAFAYPHGRYDAGTVGLVEAAGYRYAYTTDGQREVEGGSDRFAIPRKYVTCHDTLDTFAARFAPRGPSRRLAPGERPMARLNTRLNAASDW
jgi:peptidoglycan/xylan/chitin deacetylase (PgdA/CDA1 family)